MRRPSSGRRIFSYFGAPPLTVPVPLWVVPAPVPVVAGLVAVPVEPDVEGLVVVVDGLTWVLLLAAVPADGVIDWPAVVPLPAVFWLPVAF